MTRSPRMRWLGLATVAAISTALAPPAMAAPTTVSFGEVRSGSIQYTEEDCVGTTTTSITHGHAELVRADTAGELLVTYEVGGTAVEGRDHAALSGETTFADGEARAEIPVTVLETWDGGILELTITPTSDVTPGTQDVAVIDVVPSSTRPDCTTFQIGEVTEATEIRATVCKVDGSLVEETQRTPGTVEVTRTFADRPTNFTWQVSVRDEVIVGPTRTIMIEGENAVVLDIPAGMTDELTFTILPEPASYGVEGPDTVPVMSSALYADSFFCSGPPTFAAAAPVLEVPAGAALPDPEVMTDEFDAHAGQRVFRVGSGALPSGVTLDDDGTFSGAPDTPGTYAFTIEACNVTDEAEACNAAVYTVTVLETLPLGGADSVTLLWSGLLAVGAGTLLLRRHEGLRAN